MPSKTAKASGMAALAAAVYQTDKASTKKGKPAPIMPQQRTDEAKWQMLNCIVPAEVKRTVMQEAEKQGLSINQVVQNALYSRYGLPETIGTNAEQGE